MIGMASSKDFFTHDEIWDDSALVNAWDEALQEYKVGVVLPPEACDLLAKPRIPLANVTKNMG